MILDRRQALVMEYVSFPEIEKPAVQAKTKKATNLCFSLFTFSCTNQTSFLDHLVCTLIIEDKLTHHTYYEAIFSDPKKTVNVFKTRRNLSVRLTL